MYVEYAIGAAANRKRVVLYDNINKIVQFNQHSAVYQTIFQFDQRILDCIKNGKLVSDYKYDLYIDEIPIDIDKGNDSDEEVLTKARKVLAKVEQLGFDEQGYRVYYSGTGYHIYITAKAFKFKPSPMLAKIVKETISKIFGDLIDCHIYHKQGLIRSCYSLNKKSGRYKVPLQIDDFKMDPYQEIMRKAEKKIEEEENVLVSNIDLSAFVDSSIPNKQINDFSQSIKDRNDEFVPLDRIATCIHTLMCRGPVDGSRHETILRIASHFKKNGIPCNLTVAAMQAWFKQGNHTALDPSRSNEEAIEYYVKYAYRKPYRYGCNDTFLKKFCRSKCIFYKNRHDYSEIQIYDVNDLTKELKVKAQTSGVKNKLELSKIFGYPDLDIDANGGELVTIAGITGGNKTSLTQIIAIGFSISENKMLDIKRLPTLYLSLEVPGWLIHRRNLQIVTGKDKAGVLEMSRKGIPPEVNAYLQHISIVETQMDVAKIEALVQDTHPSIVMIDYLDLIDKKRNSEAYALTENMTALRNMASRLGIIIVLVTQVNREAAKERKIDLTSGKGSGSIENSSFKFISITGDPAKPERVINMHKNTDGQIFGPLKCVWQHSHRLVREDKV